MKVVIGLNNGLHNVPLRIEPGQSSLAPPPFNNNNNIFESSCHLPKPTHRRVPLSAFPKGTSKHAGLCSTIVRVSSKDAATSLWFDSTHNGARVHSLKCFIHY